MNELFFLFGLSPFRGVLSKYFFRRMSNMPWRISMFWCINTALTVCIRMDNNRQFCFSRARVCLDVKYDEWNELMRRPIGVLYYISSLSRHIANDFRAKTTVLLLTFFCFTRFQKMEKKIWKNFHVRHNFIISFRFPCTQ